MTSRTKLYLNNRGKKKVLVILTGMNEKDKLQLRETAHHFNNNSAPVQILTLPRYVTCQVIKY